MKCHKRHKKYIIELSDLRHKIWVLQVLLVALAIELEEHGPITTFRKHT